jgi:CheY-like chemotaxis protein
VSDYQVLLVEDDPFVAEVMLETIAAFGCTVEWNDSAQPALDRLASGFTPDLILSDIRMPGISGVEFASKVNETWPDLKIVLMTGYTEEFENIPPDQRRDVLLKPIDRESLYSMLKECLPSA